MADDHRLFLQLADNLLEVIRHLPDCLVGEDFRLRLRFYDRLGVVRPPRRQRNVAGILEDLRPAIPAAWQQPERPWTNTTGCLPVEFARPTSCFSCSMTVVAAVLGVFDFAMACGITGHALRFALEFELD
jgi:hypothetical protein